jgi:peptide/nickel transport system substrate-binding protein
MRMARRPVAAKLIALGDAHAVLSPVGRRTLMKRRTRRLRALTAALLIASGVALVLVSGPAAAPRHSAVKTGGTLKVEMPWGTMPDNFNPLTSQGSQAGGTLSCLYEQLFYNNPVTSKLSYVLGTSYKWQHKNLTLVVNTRKNVKWTDGKSFTAADVAFTFNYVKANPSIDVNGIWTGTTLKSVKATGKNQVTFGFKKPDTPAIVIFAAQFIVPQHIWSSIKDPATAANTHPVGTGPFTMGSYSPTTIVYKKNPHYWMKGHPYIAQVLMTAVKSNDTALLDLINNNIQYTYDAITNPDKTYVAHDKAHLKYWWPVTNDNFLVFNTKKAPYNKAAFRRALAWGLNTKLIAKRAYFGAIPASTGMAETGAIPGQVHSWINPKPLKPLMWSHNVSKAKSLLAKAGYKLKNGKLTMPDGKAIPSQTILIGGPGWTDYITIASMISQELKALGIDSSVIQAPWATYSGNLPAGKFDMALTWAWGASGGPSPYFIYYYNFAKAQIAGKTNMSRYTSKTIEKALARYAASSDPKVQKAAVQAIAKNVMANVPVIPITARTNFFDYNTKSFVGWPNYDKPFNAGEAPDNPGGKMVLINVHRR